MDGNPLTQKYGRAFEPGELIFDEDEEGDHMFIIQEGQVQISRDINGQDSPMALLEKGEFFGEMAIVNHIRRTARARAQAHTQLLAFDRSGLEQLVEKNPKIALSIIDRLCRRLVSANAHIRQMAQKTASKSMLIALHVRSQREEGLGTLQHIRDELGMTFQCPQSDIDALVGGLVEKKVLAHQGDDVVILDRAAFQKLADS